VLHLVETRPEGATEMEEDHQPDKGNDDDDHEDESPTRSGLGRSAGGTSVGVVFSLGGAARVVHAVPLLLPFAVSGPPNVIETDCLLDEQVVRAQHQVHQMIRDLLIDAVKTGDVRDDVPPDELATYCVHALTGAGSQRSKTAVRRLVSVTLAGLRPPRSSSTNRRSGPTSSGS